VGIIIDGSPEPVLNPHCECPCHTDPLGLCEQCCRGPAASPPPLPDHRGGVDCRRCPMSKECVGFDRCPALAMAAGPLPDHREALDYSTKYEGRAYTDPVDFHGRAEKCVFAIHGALMLGTEGVPEALRYLKAWTDAALRLLDAPAPVAAPEHDAHEGTDLHVLDPDHCTECGERRCAASPADGATKGEP
jgi:hypothetical protein